MKFQEFGKITRLSRECVITEKIDGTNAQIYIVNEEEVVSDLSGKFAGLNDKLIVKINSNYIFAGSRKRWITTKDDNFGFAKWVKENVEELLKLGAGRHYGEWWGKRIQRGYDLKEKVFSLFNVYKWDNDTRPKCCRVVPVLFRGMFDTHNINDCLVYLRKTGSQASPYFMNPEGIIIFHTHGGQLFKKTIKNDEVPKSQAKE